jgi:hypothetical protein
LETKRENKLQTAVARQGGAVPHRGSVSATFKPQHLLVPARFVFDNTPTLGQRPRFGLQRQDLFKSPVFNRRSVPPASGANSTICPENVPGNPQEWRG